ncbi:9059_t:CDS:1, partial [Paraglomus brasilianum]
LIKGQQDDIKNSSENIEDLRKVSYIPQVDLGADLGYPRTVCTSKECIDVLTIKESTLCHYKTHCHPRCFLNGITCNVVNHEALRHCAAMGQNGICQNCGCLWNTHMHIRYENVNKDVDTNIKISLKDALMENIQERTEKLRNEQQVINSINIQFAKFLRQSAIAPFNDAYADYLDLFINEEKVKKSADPFNYDNEILEGLEETKRVYLTEIESIKEALKNGDSSEQPISPDDIEKLEQQLYSLELNGKILKRIKDVIVSSQASAHSAERNDRKSKSSEKPVYYLDQKFHGIFEVPWKKIQNVWSSFW